MSYWYGNRLDVLPFEPMPNHVRAWYPDDGQWVSGYLSSFQRAADFTTRVSQVPQPRWSRSSRDTHCFLFLNRFCDVSPKTWVLLSITSTVITHFLQQTDCLLSWTGFVEVLLELNPSTVCGGYFPKHSAVCAVGVHSPFISPHMRAHCLCVIVLYVLYDLWQTVLMPSKYTFHHFLSWLLGSEFSVLMHLS